MTNCVSELFICSIVFRHFERAPRPSRPLQKKDMLPIRADGSSVEADFKEEEDHKDESTLLLSGDFDSSEEGLTGASSFERGRNIQVSI